MTRSTFESIKSDRCYLGLPENQVPHGQSVCLTTKRLRFKLLNFSCTEPNAYITNTLNNRINFTHSSARFLFLSCVHSLFSCFATKWRGEGQDVFVLLRERVTYLLDVHKPFLYVVFRIRKRWECSGLESRQCGGVLRGMFFRENDKINESWRNQRKERTGRGTVMSLWE